MQPSQDVNGNNGAHLQNALLKENPNHLRPTILLSSQCSGGLDYLVGENWSGTE